MWCTPDTTKVVVEELLKIVVENGSRFRCQAQEEWQILVLGDQDLVILKTKKLKRGRLQGAGGEKLLQAVFIKPGSSVHASISL